MVLDELDTASGRRRARADLKLFLERLTRPQRAELMRLLSAIPVALTEQIAEIARRLATQDNCITYCPIFIVQEKRRIYGFDTDCADADQIVWLDSENDCDEADALEHARLESLYLDGEDIPGKWIRTAYQDTWKHVTSCFTEAGCAEYIRCNKHHHRGELRIYAGSSHRNDEWAVRGLLLAIGEAPAADLGAGEEMAPHHPTLPGHDLEASPS